jgi:hypothetical protein
MASNFASFDKHLQGHYNEQHATKGAHQSMTAASIFDRYAT